MEFVLSFLGWYVYSWLSYVPVLVSTIIYGLVKLCALKFEKIKIISIRVSWDVETEARVNYTYKRGQFNRIGVYRSALKGFYFSTTLFLNFLFLVQIVLAVGTKLEIIVARMALQIKQQNSVIIGTPLVKPNDDLFWFGKPKFVLTLLHYILFVVIL